jgi:hypothetical protein
MAWERHHTEHHFHDELTPNSRKSAIQPTLV